MATTTLNLKFEKDEDKKHSIRFKEVGDEPVLGTIYVKRANLKELGNEDGSKSLELTMKVGK